MAVICATDEWISVGAPFAHGILHAHQALFSSNIHTLASDLQLKFVQQRYFKFEFQSCLWLYIFSTRAQGRASGKVLVQYESTEIMKILLKHGIRIHIYINFLSLKVTAKWWQLTSAPSTSSSSSGGSICFTHALCCNNRAHLLERVALFTCRYFFLLLRLLSKLDKFTFGELQLVHFATVYCILPHEKWPHPMHVLVSVCVFFWLLYRIEYHFIVNCTIRDMHARYGRATMLKLSIRRFGLI